jgi:hypothetical protein
MKPYATFRRHPLGEVVPHTNEDRHPLEVVPFGKFGAGVWTGHPIGLFVVAGIMIGGLVAVPAWRWFFAGSVLAGSVVGYFLWRHHQPK